MSRKARSSDKSPSCGGCLQVKVGHGSTSHPNPLSISRLLLFHLSLFSMGRKIREEQWPSSAPTIIPTVGMHTEQGPLRAKGFLLLPSLFSSLHHAFIFPCPFTLFSSSFPRYSQSAPPCFNPKQTNHWYFSFSESTTRFLCSDEISFLVNLCRQLPASASCPTTHHHFPHLSFILSLSVCLPSALHRPLSSWHYKLTFATTKQLERSLSLPTGAQTHKDMWTYYYTCSRNASRSRKAMLEYKMTALFLFQLEA